MTYRGRPWRSRFLRAPKQALHLPTMGTFVPLGALASVRLGMKTGADSFFYVVELSPQEEAQLKSDRGLERRPPGSVAVQGLGGWKGFISRHDLRPAIRNPHELQKSGEPRQFKIPASSGVQYLFPRDRSPQGDLATYVDLGERQRIHQGDLVQSNASGRRWYRQARGIVDSPLALPYNSAYDYGAWDNRVGAVLNGRFVGLTPNDHIDTDVLLAVLNSTYTILSRLTEGVATGVEAAFDVGPPAARLMLVPDVRTFDPEVSAELRALVREMSEANVMPPAPSADMQVPNLRRQLDLTVLRALGHDAADASYFAGKAYESYARWRASVEEVEARMRVYRRGMTKGGARRKPLDLLGTRLWEDLADRVRLLPSSLLSADDEMEEVDIDRRYRLPDQEPLLEAGRVELADGSIGDLGSYDRVRYAHMMLRLGFEPPVPVPVDETRCRKIVDDYEREAIYLANLAKEQADDLVDETSLPTVLNAVRREWSKACREAGSRPH